jgi:hypothetical protein
MAQYTPKLPSVTDSRTLTDSMRLIHRHYALYLCWPLEGHDMAANMSLIDSKLQSIRELNYMKDIRAQIRQRIEAKIEAHDKRLEAAMEGRPRNLPKYAWVRRAREKTKEELDAYRLEYNLFVEETNVKIGKIRAEIEQSKAIEAVTIWPK